MFAWTEPLLRVINSTKLLSSVESIGNLESFNSTFNLWAPLAAKLFEPVALSVRLESVSGVAKLSVTVKPTRAFSSIEFVLSIKVSAWFLTNCPLMKYTPSSTLTAEPLCEAFDENVVADATSIPYEDVCVIATLAVIFSPSARNDVLAEMNSLL